MTRTPIFDALAEELDVTLQNSGDIPTQTGRSGADEEDRPLSGHLE
jgi:hypothetical protein